MTKRILKDKGNFKRHCIRLTRLVQTAYGTYKYAHCRIEFLIPRTIFMLDINVIFTPRCQKRILETNKKYNMIWDMDFPRTHKNDALKTMKMIFKCLNNKNKWRAQHKICFYFVVTFFIIYELESHFQDVYLNFHKLHFVAVCKL